MKWCISPALREIAAFVENCAVSSTTTPHSLPPSALACHHYPFHGGLYAPLCGTETDEQPALCSIGSCFATTIGSWIRFHFNRHQKDKAAYERVYLQSEADGLDIGYFVNYHLRTLVRAFEHLEQALTRQQRRKNAHTII